MVSFIVISWSISSLLMNNGIETSGIWGDLGVPPTNILRISAPELREEPFVNQFLDKAVVEKLFGLRLLRFRIGSSDLIQGDLKSGALDERHLFHELVAVLETSLQHFLLLDLGVFGKNRQ